MQHKTKITLKDIRRLLTKGEITFFDKGCDITLEMVE